MTATDPPDKPLGPTPPPGAAPRQPSIWRALGILPLLLLGMAVVFVVFTAGQHLRRAIDGTPITSKGLAQQTPSAEHAGSDVAPDPIHWGQDVNAAMTQAREAGKPVLLDFTADWCPPCQELKRDLYTLTDIRQTIESRFVPLKIDLTEPNGPNVPVATRMGVDEIPTLIALTPSGEELSRFSDDPTAENFRRWLSLMAAKGTRPVAVHTPHG